MALTGIPNFVGKACTKVDLYGVLLSHKERALVALYKGRGRGKDTEKWLTSRFGHFSHSLHLQQGYDPILILKGISS